jgi:hypothetical protein
MENNLTEIEVLIDRLSDISAFDMKHYFKKKYRGRFYCQVKKMACSYLKNSGYGLADIAEIVYNDRKKHDCVFHNLRNNKDEINDYIRQNWKQLVMTKTYPKTNYKSISKEPKDDFERSMANHKGRYIINYSTYKLEKHGL